MSRRQKIGTSSVKKKMIKPWFLRSGEVRESQGKIRKKVRLFRIPKSGKNKRVRESQGKSKYQSAKVNKDAEKNF